MSRRVMRNWLKALRAAKGLSAAETARAVGVKQRAVFAWEAGTKSPSRENAYALARVLGPEVHVHLAAEELADSGEEVA